ncbi:MAG: hypothetical protein WC842_03255 [Candidatus Paceibacterota bacterium]|jgi:ribulose-phosphate 3-epimerase
MNIIPTINVKTKEEAERAIQTLQELPITWVQFDIGDGVFSASETWDGPQEAIELIEKYMPHVFCEAHIMKRSPEESARGWIDAGARRIIIHYETVDEKTMKSIISYAKEKNVRMMIALLPNTPISVLEKYEEVNEVQILAVHPGPSGQSFIFEMVEKIKLLKRTFPFVYIEIDGGINRDTALLVAKAHADAVAVNAYLSKSREIKKDFLLLKEIV